MSDGGFDVLVIAFAPRAHELPASALARIVGIAEADAAALCRALPCAVLRDVAYARAEAIAASLQLAGAEVRVAPHAQADIAPEPGRMTVPEVGFAAARGLGAGREVHVRPLGPSTLRPPNVSDAEPALVHAGGARASLAAHDAPETAAVARPGMDTVRQVSEPLAASLGPAAAAASPDLETGWALAVDDAARAAPLAASPQPFAADFGKGLAGELDLVPARRRAALAPELRGSALQLDPPRPPSASMRPVGRAAAAGSARTAHSAPASRPAPSGRAASPLARQRLEVGGELTMRTIVLLALLWLSVGLLLWSHDLL